MNKHLLINSSSNKYECFLMPERHLYFEKNVEGCSANVVNFLAITHAIALQLKENKCLDIHTNNQAAISCIKNKVCYTETKNELVQRAEQFLQNNDFSHIKIVKEDSDIIEKIKIEKAVQELEDFFRTCNLPQIFQLTPYMTITDTQKFIENSLYICKHSNPKLAKLALYRLNRLKEKCSE